MAQTQSTNEQVLEQVQHENDEAQQFDIGWSIINEAFTNEMKTLVSRINYAKADIEDKTSKIDTLVEKQHDFDVAYAEAEARLQQLVEENMGHLSSIKSLRGQVDKLKAFKENVVTSISDAQAAVEAAEATFDTQPSFAAEPSPPGASSMMHPPGPESPEPPSWSQSGAGMGFGDGDGVDGKDFFKHVRTRLSYESFNSFLASIKKLNSHQNTRDETLAEAKNIFGLKDTDLYSQFEKLLSRHV